MRPGVLTTGGFGICLLAACPGPGGSTTETGTTDPTETTGTGTGTTTTDDTTTGDPPTGTGTGTGTTTDTPTGSGTTGGEGPVADCQTQYAEMAKQNEWDCGCQVEAGLYPDVPTCLEDWFMEDPSCLCPILAADPDNAGFLACIAAGEQTFSACITPLACDDANAYDACVQAYFEATATCGEPTKASNGEVGLQCFDTPPFMCESGETIPDLYTCDQEPDCPDMSDESMDICSFMCMSGETIPKIYTCDRRPDCMDGSDETPELCEFMCGSGESIPKTWVCDNRPDCEDGSDEADCP